MPQRILREPLLYLLPVLAVVYFLLMQTEKPHDGFKSLSLMHYAFTLLLLLSFSSILKKFKFGNVAILFILLGVCVRLMYFSYTEPTIRYLQQVSMLFSFASLAFGVALLYRLFRSTRLTWMACLLFVLWPGFVTVAPRIGNDAPFYFGALMCMFYTQIWWTGQRSGHLLLAFIGAAIAVAFKLTGFSVLGVLLIIFVCGIFRFWRLPSLAVLVGIFAIALLSVFASKYNIIPDYTIKDPAKDLTVHTSFGSFAYFDMRDYLTKPYTDDDSEQYFWNSFVKSTLYGKYSVWNSGVGRIFANIMNVLNLVFFLLIIWGILNMRTPDLPSLLFFLAMLASLVFARAYYSVSSMQDYRYIAPTLVPMLLFAVNGASILQNARLRAGAFLCMIFFAILSFFFIALQGL
ncbi:MAG: hypothetical protein FWC26_07000 [Fibromonadales bacterium]|nr:hypothetical protein [Fibromonadales bacterium]